MLLFYFYGKSNVSFNSLLSYLFLTLSLFFSYNYYLSLKGLLGIKVELNSIILPSESCFNHNTASNYSSIDLIINLLSNSKLKSVDNNLSFIVSFSSSSSQIILD